MLNSNETGTPIKVLSGVNGQIELYTDRVIIRSKGLLAKLARGLSLEERTICLDQITNVDIYSGSSFFLSNGYLRLTIARQPQKVIIVFNRKDYALAQQIKDTLEDFISRRRVMPHLRSFHEST